MLVNKLNSVCVYHSNCADGFGAALAVKLLHDKMGVEVDFIPAHYGDDVDLDRFKAVNVFIVDFSYPRKTLMAINEVATKLIVLDHHKTAEENLKGLDFCIFDMEKSGAMLTWEHCFDTKAPALIHAIQDRDLWRFKLPTTKAISAGLRLIPMDFDTWGYYLDDDNLGELIEYGNVILRYEEQQVKRAAGKDINMVSICGYLVPCINTTTLISEIGHELCKGHAFALMYFETHDKRVYSLRSDDGGIDVSKIARKFGGGGHKNAAGFSISKFSPKLDDFIL